MKRMLLTTLLVASMAAAVSAQSIGEASALYNAKEYKASGEMYDKALAKGKDNPTDYYNAACSWALAGDNNKALSHLQQAVAKGYINLSHLKQDTDLNSLHQEKRWKTLVQDLEKKVATLEANYNKPLKAQLEQIYKTDQEIRMKIEPVQKEFGPESPQMKALWEEMAKTDEANKKEVVAILEKYGWPGKSMVGPQANSAAFLVIQHSDKETMEKYLPMLREAVAKGEAAKSQLALMEDRVRMNNGQPQLYGSQLRMNAETGQYELYTIEDEVNVDKRRASMDLEPLTDYMKRFGIDYQVPQALSN
ncbi:hypothetical protein DXT99_09330 [Pontibacter diazotrophicus]|uniref:Tetratricopeptide repeat protein n=1 Tax=Pontibacter diazotrophicus TaxID=1400979 RepID=A0A3D8LFG8_9BACT|nr:DUF6624 domain-containing protein [Pontibacter diazotrophicus]RDV15672.1 hypothetical protein DXT99_09330 [Pontibacter diazotrophicus]